MTVHRWFAAKACPGDYLYNRHGAIAEEVNKRLGVADTKTEASKETTPAAKKLYRIRKSWGDVASQKGAYEGLSGAKSVCPEGYTVYDENGKAVYTKSATKAETTTSKGESTVNIELKVLNKGDEGETVKALQRMLYAMGYELGSKPVDGSFGAKTETAVRAYQKKKGLTVDGKVGAKTWTKLLKG